MRQCSTLFSPAAPSSRGYGGESKRLGDFNTNRPSDANPPKVIQFFGFESDDHGVTLSGREAPPAMPQHLSRAADSGNAPGELAST